jgi:hypothetical protein
MDIPEWYTHILEVFQAVVRVQQEVNKRRLEPKLFLLLDQSNL